MSQSFRSANWYRVWKVRPRLAPELRVQRQTWRGRPWYVLFDPLNQRTQRLTPQAWYIVSRMDGSHTVQELFDTAVAHFGDEAPPQDELIQLLAQLHDTDALVSDALPDLEDLARRRQQKRRQQWKQRLANPLALRLPLWDPDAFLSHTLPAVAWMLTPLGALLWLALTLPAAALAWMHWGEIVGNASDSLLSASSLLTMLLVYPLIKALHELAHAYTARKGGAEVHDLGVMFLVLFPIPYVDASGTSAFARKSQRALVAGIGMMTELLLSALALYLWLVVEPGSIRSLAFSVMVLGGVSTLLFNGNPLLRFDGYYLLCDLIEIANLGQRSTQYWQWLVKRHAFGLERAQAPESTPGERRWFLAYAPLALAYRVFITASIALFLGSEYLYVGLAIALWGIVMQFVWPLLKGLRYVWSSHELVGRRARPLGVSLGVVALAATLLLAVPMPMTTYAQGVVWPAESAQLRADESGFVTEMLVEPGAAARAGLVIARLANDTLQTDLDVAQARITQQRSRYLAALADARNPSDNTTNARVRAVLGVRALAQAREDQRHAASKAADLQVTARRNGRIELPMAADLPGRWLRKGDSLGHLDTGEAPTVRVVVTQDDVDLVRAHLLGIRVRLAGDLGEARDAILVREVPGGDDTLPSQALALDNGGTVAVDPRGEEPHTLSRVFQFDLQLPAAAAGARVGERAHVRFVHAMEPLGMQWGRRLRQLLLSRLGL